MRSLSYVTAQGRVGAQGGSLRGIGTIETPGVTAPRDTVLGAGSGVNRNRKEKWASLGPPVLSTVRERM
jgi:acetyltransferase-like isoleucine patch superfamily enzyme